MTPERWGRVEEIFLGAANLPEPERAAYVVERCGGDAELEAEVASLLAEQSGLGSFLERTPPGLPPAGGVAGEGELPDADAHIGRYRKQRLLGQGGFGVVWLAWDAELERPVAVKVLHRWGTRDTARFRREATLAAGLSHPNIVSIYEVGDDPTFIAMQYVEGSTADGMRVTAEEAARIVRDAARAVQHAHERGVVHRDLKPQNLMVGPEGRVYVMDFGMARPMASRDALTVTGAIVGTPAYMSPEQARGDAVDARADVYGLGATLYTLLTGLPPFEGEDVMSVLRQVVDQDPAWPRQVRPKVDRDLDVVVQHAMAKEPERRYPSAGALADDLDRHLAGESIEARPAGIAYRAWRRVRQSPVASLLAMALVLVTSTAAGWWYMRETRLRLVGVPEGAEVTIDGTPAPRGQDALIAPGVHRLRIRHPDYLPLDQEVTVARGQAREFSVDPRRREGRLVVESDVPGAAIELSRDGTLAGRFGAPAEATLPVGRYEGRAYAPGHATRWLGALVENDGVATHRLFLRRAGTWRLPMGNTPIHPLLLPDPETGRLVVVSGIYEGRLVVVDAMEGTVLHEWRREDESYVGDLAAGRFRGPGTMEVAVPVQSGARLRLLSMPALTEVADHRIGPVASSGRVRDVTAGDVDGDGIDELFLRPRGRDEALVLAPGSGEIRWRLHVVEESRIPLFRDLDRDGRAELVWAVGSRIEVREGATGSPLMVVDGTRPVFVVADADGDGRRDVVTHGCDGVTRALGFPGGRVLWESRVGSYAKDTEVLIDAVDPPVVVFYADDHDVARVLDVADGRLLWAFSAVRNPVWPTPSLADMDRDGRLELVVHDMDHREQRGLDLDTGAPVWAAATEPYFDTRIGDVDGNGYPEQVLMGASELVGGRDHAVIFEDRQPQGIRSSPVAADLDGDGVADVVAGSRLGRVRGYSVRRGTQLFELAEKTSAVTPLVLGAGGASPLRVICGSWVTSDTVTSWTVGDGRPPRIGWRRNLAAGLEGEMGLGDLDGDGAPEVVVATWEGRPMLAALDAATGQVRWQHDGSAPFRRGPVVADLDGDGRLDVIAGSGEGRVHALRGDDGAPMWSRDAGGVVGGRVLVGQRTAYVCAGPSVRAFDAATGVPTFAVPIVETTTDPALADLDGDRARDLLVVDGQGVLRGLDPSTGAPRFRVPLGAAAGRGIALADMDGDGSTDAVAGLADGRVTCYSGRRRAVIWSTRLGHDGRQGRIEGIPAVADFDGDGATDIAVGTLDGWLYVVSGRAAAGP